jgi:nucleoside-diphosphate-sugar epimerase
MRSNSVFSIFIRCALAAEPITIQGSGEQSRQFTHEHDIARGFESALKLGRPGAAYNLVAERAITIRELGKAVAALAPTELTLGPARPADVPSAIVTSELAKRDLLWSAETNFEDGLRELVDQARSAKALQRR